MIGTQSGSVISVTSTAPSSNRSISSALLEHLDRAGGDRLADGDAGEQAARRRSWRR